jgi:adenylate cyclase
MIELLTELRRRKVFRVAVVYGAVAFVIAQAADIAFPALQLPPWTVTLVVVLAIAGFPIALILAWAFELTPDGVVRTTGSAAGAGYVGAGGPTSGDWGPGRRLALGVVVVGLAVAIAAFIMTGRPPAPAIAVGADPDRSIAVLPFEDLSPARDHEWFSDGITEDIQTHLATIGDLKVIGRTSVLRYKGTTRSAREIGAELSVAAILEGSVRRLGDHVRITTKLIDAVTEEQLWAESYDRELTDIFRIQSDIARHIAESLRTRFSPEYESRLATAPTVHLAAYDHFLKGREHARRLTRHDLDQAVLEFRRALELDPRFAGAYAELSFAFAGLDGYHGAGPHWRDSAEVAARRAIEVDPAAADGYVALGAAQWNAGRLADGVETYGRALAIRPNDPLALWGLSFARQIGGHLAEALRLSKRAVDLDPAVPLYVTLLGRSYGALGYQDAAVTEFRRAIELQSDFPWAHNDLLLFLIWNGQYDEAADHLRVAVEVLPPSWEVLNASALLALRSGEYATAAVRYDSLLDYLAQRQSSWSTIPFDEAGFAHAKSGAAKRAVELWDEGRGRVEAALDDGGDSFWWLQIRLARIAALTGDTDEALRQLEAAYAAGWRGLFFTDIGVDPLLEDLHGDPRFERLRMRIRDDVRGMRAQVDREGW